jgi:hypothetical protein
MQIVNGCPNLRAVAIMTGSSKYLSSLVRALTPSLALTTIDIYHPPIPPETSLPLLEFINSLLAYPSLEHVTEIALDDLEEESPTPAILPPSIRRSLSSLEVTTWSRSDFDSVKRYFIRDSSPLKTLKVEMQDESPVYQPQDLRWIYDYVPSTLEQLQLRAPNHYNCVLSTYLQPRGSPPLLPDFFPSLPSLRRLEISGFHGLSLRLLQSLASAAPSVQYLSFTCSFWMSNTPIDPAAPPSVFANLVFPEKEILKVLLSFPSLKYVDLGIVPTIDQDRYLELEDRLAESGIDYDWEECCELEVDPYSDI